jgi:NAD(P)-dependent dehydrogenase (short-subunit alcohol dehydrogenase family)
MGSSLAGKKVLVTGSSSGIGLGIALALRDMGCQLVINGRDVEKLKLASDTLPDALAITADVSSAAEAQRLISRAADHLGGLDAVVCNVGSGASVPPGNESFDEWQRVFSTNLWSTTNVVEASKGVLAQSKGNIVCISSICGIETIPGAPVTYSVAKAALNAYISGISRPLGKQGIRINGIAPGNIMFPGSVWDRKSSEDAEAVKTMLSAEVPLERLGTIDDIAQFVAFILSDNASFTTGEVFVVDGGQVRR